MYRLLLDNRFGTLYVAFCFLNALVSSQSLITFCSIQLDIGPTGTTTTNIATNTNAVLSIIQALSFISCSQGQTASVSPFAYIGGPNDIVEGQALTFTVGPYATTYQSILLTQIYPTVTLETVQPTVLVWNQPIALAPISDNVNPGLIQSTSFTLVIQKGAEATVTVTGGSSLPSPPSSSPNLQVTSTPTLLAGENPTTTSSSTTSQSSAASASLSGGAIGGIVVGSIIGGGIIGALVLLLFLRSKRPAQGAQSVEYGHPEADKSVGGGKTEIAEPAEVASGMLRYPENIEVSGNLESP